MITDQRRPLFFKGHEIVYDTDDRRRVVQAFEVGAVKLVAWPFVTAYSRYYDMLGVVEGSWGVYSVVDVVFGPTRLAPGDLVALTREPKRPTYRKVPLP